MAFRAVGFFVVCTFASLHAFGTCQSPVQRPPTQFFTGKVVALALLLEKKGIKLDADAAAHSLVLVADDGKILVLIKNDDSRMFFKDKRLLDRPMRLTGKMIPGTQMLQVTQVHSIIGGKLHDVYYWCETCQLRSSEAGTCKCCGATTELIEEPVH